MQAGVSWDMRSWEPAVWFLKKHWYLLDARKVACGRMLAGGI